MADATIHVHRESGPFRDRLRSYKVLVDDEVVGKVKPGEDVRHAVPPGEHVVRIRIDWTGSKPLTVTAEPGETVSLVCAPNGPAWMGMVDLLLFRTWVDLRRA